MMTIIATFMCTVLFCMAVSFIWRVATSNPIFDSFMWQVKCRIQSNGFGERLFNKSAYQLRSEMQRRLNEYDKSFWMEEQSGNELRRNCMIDVSIYSMGIWNLNQPVVPDIPDDAELQISSKL